MGCTHRTGHGPKKPFETDSAKKDGMEMMEAITAYQSGDCDLEPRVAVVGIGGAGCNVLSSIYWADGSVDTIAINTDREALKTTDADKKLYICKEVMKGEGTNGDSFLGRRCAKIHKEEIESALSGYDAVFIVAGMGGGTGSGVAPVVADIAQRLNAMTFSVLINPFSFETARMKVAREGIAQMKAVCRTVVTVENDLILKNMPDVPMNEAFRAVNSAISRFVTGQKKSLTCTLADYLHLNKIEDVAISFYPAEMPDEIRTHN
jgi:cell division protein FtsZ